MWTSSANFVYATSHSLVPFPPPAQSSSPPSKPSSPSSVQPQPSESPLSSPSSGKSSSTRDKRTGASTDGRPFSTGFSSRWQSWELPVGLLGCSSELGIERDVFWSCWGERGIYLSRGSWFICLLHVVSVASSRLQLVRTVFCFSFKCLSLVMLLLLYLCFNLDSTCQPCREGRRRRPCSARLVLDASKKPEPQGVSSSKAEKRQTTESHFRGV